MEMRYFLITKRLLWSLLRNGRKVTPVWIKFRKLNKSTNICNKLGQSVIFLSVHSYLFQSSQKWKQKILVESISKALRRAGLHHAESLFGAGVLGDGLGSFRDGMFGQFTGEEEPNGGLNFPRSNGSPENEKKNLWKFPDVRWEGH